jgi:hypothetical protein
MAEIGWATVKKNSWQAEVSSGEHQRTALGTNGRVRHAAEI